MPAPLDYNPAGWWRAADSGVQGNQFVATDLSGNNRHAVQTTPSAYPQRAYRPTGIYDWAWSFDGAQWLPVTTMQPSQGAQTVIALARSTNTSLTTRRVCGFDPFYSAFGNGTQWGYYARTNDTIANLGGNTANWTVVAVRQCQIGPAGYAPQTLTVAIPCDLETAFHEVDVIKQPLLHNDQPQWMGVLVYEQITTVVRVRYENLGSEWPDYAWTIQQRDSSDIELLHGWRNNYSFVGYFNSYYHGYYRDAVANTSEAEGAYGYRDNGIYAGFWLPKLLSNPSSLSLAIGAEGPLGGQKWVGHIADVMVFNDFLSIEAIQDIYTNYFVPRYFVQPIVAKQRAGRMAIGGLTI